MANSCAKINLGLYIVERRPDDYHNIETIFYPIPLCDEISINEDDNDKLLISGIPVAGNVDDNLVIKALRLVRQDYKVPPVCISLKKNIPSGAGLGGGSSDAACMMKLLNNHFCLDMEDFEMEQKVSSLGADCAFFIKSKPVFAQGIGNEFSPISLNLSGYYIALVKPNEFVSTREAYSMVKPTRPEFDLRRAIHEPIESWKDIVFNDFEKSIFPLHPAIANIKHLLYQLGALYASMSGSGSSVYAIFKEDPSQYAELFSPSFFFSSKL